MLQLKRNVAILCLLVVMWSLLLVPSVKADIIPGTPIEGMSQSVTMSTTVVNGVQYPTGSITTSTSQSNELIILGIQTYVQYSDPITAQSFNISDSSGNKWSFRTTVGCYRPPPVYGNPPYVCSNGTPPGQTVGFLNSLTEFYAVAPNPVPSDKVTIVWIPRVSATYYTPFYAMVFAMLGTVGAFDGCPCTASNVQFGTSVQVSTSNPSEIVFGLLNLDSAFAPAAGFTGIGIKATNLGGYSDYIGMEFQSFPAATSNIAVGAKTFNSTYGQAIPVNEIAEAVQTQPSSVYTSWMNYVSQGNNPLIIGGALAVLAVVVAWLLERGSLTRVSRPRVPRPPISVYCQ